MDNKKVRLVARLLVVIAALALLMPTAKADSDTMRFRCPDLSMCDDCHNMGTYFDWENWVWAQVASCSNCYFIDWYGNCCTADCSIDVWDYGTQEWRYAENVLWMNWNYCGCDPYEIGRP